MTPLEVIGAIALGAVCCPVAYKIGDQYIARVLSRVLMAERMCLHRYGIDDHAPKCGVYFWAWRWQAHRDRCAVHR